MPTKYDVDVLFNEKHYGPCAADVNALKVPDNLSDEKVLLLSDILPTAWHANELAGVGEGDSVAIW